MFKLGTSGAGSTKAMIRDVVEPVYHVGLVNTILMDCLHHGIKSVKSLDTSALILPDLDAQTINENVIWAALPAIESHLSKEERKVVMRNHDMYIEGLVENYFGGEDYTLFYVTESRHDVEVKEDNADVKEYQMESEVPLVAHGELARRALTIQKNKSGNNNSTLINGPLFDRFQFFSPGTCKPFAFSDSYSPIDAYNPWDVEREMMLTQSFRYLHGPSCYVHSHFTHVRRCLGTRKSTGHLRCFRQGTRSACRQEGLKWFLCVAFS